jgi:hypothetical protein
MPEAPSELTPEEAERFREVCVRYPAPPVLDADQKRGWIAAYTPSDPSPIIIADVSARGSAMSGSRVAPAVIASIAGGGPHLGKVRAAMAARRAGFTWFLRHDGTPGAAIGKSVQRVAERLRAALRPSQPRLSDATTKLWMEERGKRWLKEEGEPWGRDEATVLAVAACGGSGRRAGRFYSKLPKALRVGRGQRPRLRENRSQDLT